MHVCMMLCPVDYGWLLGLASYVVGYQHELRNQVFQFSFFLLPHYVRVYVCTCVYVEQFFAVEVL